MSVTGKDCEGMSTISKGAKAQWNTLLTEKWPCEAGMAPGVTRLELILRQHKTAVFIINERLK